MSWLLGGVYCAVIWLVFAKWRLLPLTLPLAILLASVGPSLIVALLFCAQYFHPYTSEAIVLQPIDPISPQLTRSGRVTEVLVEPNVPVAAGDVLFKVDPVPYQNAVKRLEASLLAATQSVKVAESSVLLADASISRAESELKLARSERDRREQLKDQDAASLEEFQIAQTQFEQTSAAVDQAKEEFEQAKMSIETAKATVQETQSQLADARYDLDQTVIKAPASGFVTNVQLRPGMLVGGPGSTSVMTFVRDNETNFDGVIVATFDQKNFLRIKPDRYCEVAMDAYPGEILTGRVLNTIDTSGAGQLTASGLLPSQLMTGQPTKFAVRIRLDQGASLRLPGGARGRAAVYTDNLQIAGIPIMFLIRAHSWLNFVW